MEAFILAERFLKTVPPDSGIMFGLYLSKFGKNVDRQRQPRLFRRRAMKQFPDEIQLIDLAFR